MRFCYKRICKGNIMPTVLNSKHLLPLIRGLQFDTKNLENTVAYELNGLIKKIAGLLR